MNRSVEVESREAIVQELQKVKTQVWDLLDELGLLIEDLSEAADQLEETISKLDYEDDEDALRDSRRTDDQGQPDPPKTD